MLEVSVGGHAVQIPDSERTTCEVWTRRCHGLLQTCIGV